VEGFQCLFPRFFNANLLTSMAILSGAYLHE
jgi:hypothetical protein